MSSSDYVGADGEPVLNRYGYARRGWEHDGRGNVVALHFFGTDGKLCDAVDGILECYGLTSVARTHMS